MYGGVLPPGTTGLDPIYMTPPEPPMSIYGTLPRKTGQNLLRVPRNGSPLGSHYATFWKERLGPRVSLKLLQQKMAGDRDQDARLCRVYRCDRIRGNHGSDIACRNFLANFEVVIFPRSLSELTGWQARQLGSHKVRGNSIHIWRAD